MISPASMKNGTAISGKLSAPLMMFCATICESKMSSECISATPHTIRAKAIGIPSAIAPSSESVQTAIVMACRARRTLAQRCSGVLLTLLDGDEVVRCRPATQDPDEVVQKDHGRGDAEHNACGIEEEADRDA